MDDDNYLKSLSEKIDELAISMEKLGIAEYVEMLNNPRRLFRINFWSGVARGFGMAIGFTVLAAVVLYAMQQIVVLNMPVIGNFIADLVNIVQNQLNVGGSVFQSHGGRI
ncbi:MAG: hypothetical protein CVU90_13065 [Firmicutes bacterium HGW-Firmicutes-15]|nr:MAG: hypothetical protein CVU90_13065 [Firmicutes bacterium HGW-Firmicutes-15]